MSVLPFAAFLAFAAFSLAVLPAPFFWVFAGAAVLAVLRFVRASGVRARRAWLGSGSFALAFAAAELLLPGPLPPYPECRHVEGERPTDAEGFDCIYGVSPARSRVVENLDMRSNRGFDVSYTFDEHGMRVGYPSEARESVLFFGCSMTLGLNVEDDEAMPYLVGKELADDYVCYNFGYSGYGPQQMLAALESGLVEEIVEEPPRHIFFQLIDSHVRRVVGNGFRLHGPRYVIAEDGSAVRVGRNCDPQPGPGPLVKLLQRSAIYREATSHTVPVHVDTLLAVVRTARDELARRYPEASFQVIQWDKRSWKSRRMRRGLDAAGIPVIPVSDVLPRQAAGFDVWYLPGDCHPTPEAHGLLAERVVHAIAGGATR